MLCSDLAITHWVAFIIDRDFVLRWQVRLIDWHQALRSLRAEPLIDDIGRGWGPAREATLQRMREQQVTRARLL